MKRIAVAVLLAASCATTAFAGPIEDRQQLMKNVQAATKDGVGLARGATPFDAAKAKAVLQVYIDASAKLPTLFPAGSDKGAKNAADAKAAQAATDTDSFKAAFGKITADCTSCHGTYRLKQ
jgi:cytochrome c556